MGLYIKYMQGAAAAMSAAGGLYDNKAPGKFMGNKTAAPLI